jgi:6-phosphogluconolactonase
MIPLKAVVGIIVIGLVFCAAVRGATTAQPSDASDAPPKNASLVYVGTYTGGKSRGIYYFWVRTQGNNVSLVPLGLAAEALSPAFLEIDSKRRLLFAVNETDKFEGKPTGSVSAFSIDPVTGKLKLINQVSSRGAGPCHLLLDKEGKNLLVANYSSGSVAVIPVAPDGKLGEATDFVQHTGKSVNPDRQTGPHAHCATLSPDNRFAFVCDLGLDKVLTYRFDAEHGRLTPSEPAFTPLKPGAGPRHMVFRPDGKSVYVINELDSTITAFAYESKTGVLKELQTVSTLPAHYSGPNTTAEIGMHPSGKFLYGSNRGKDSVVLFEIDPDKGTLAWVEDQSTGGKKPRYFGILPSAKNLVICNQDSDTIQLARIDLGTGRLKPSGVFAECSSPVCAVFLLPVGGDKEKAMTGD